MGSVWTSRSPYPLVVLPPEQGALVPVAAELVVERDCGHDAEPDLRAFVAFLWRRFCQLAVLFFIALALLRRLRRRVSELRQQVGYWRAQQQRAVQREAEAKDQVHLLEGEIRELKRRLFGRTSETSSSTQPTTNPKPTGPTKDVKRKRGQQPGSTGPGRRNHQHLPTTAENCTRYSAYKAMAQVKAGKLTLAFCWAHVRRDFLAVLTGWSELTDWAWSWVEDIGTLYHRNDQRLALEAGTLKQTNADLLLRDHVAQMRQRCENELAEPKLRLPQRKALTSLQEHWPGLTVFVDHPDVPLDNNEAERRQRGPVVARKNYYGSGAWWSGQLAAMLFSLFQTLHVWGMDTGKWLTAYLTACAKAKGQPPPDPPRYLPWNMTAQEREALSVVNPPDTNTTNRSNQ